MKNIHNSKTNETISCPKCQLAFQSKNKLYYHIQLIHTKQGTRKCEICDEDFPNEARLKSHIKCYHMLRAMYQCSKCNMAFKLKKLLDEHFDAIHEKEKNSNAVLVPKRLLGVRILKDT